MSGRKLFAMTDPAIIKRNCVLLVLCLLSIASSSHGQQLHSNGSTSLRVIVTDAEQHSVTGAACSLFRPGVPPAVAASATTDEQGMAVFQKITSGVYTLRVQSKGF